MKQTLQDMAQEISRSLALEMGHPKPVERPASASITDLLLQYLAREVTRQLEEANSGNGLSEFGLEARLERVERRLEKLTLGEEEGIATEHQDEDEPADTGSGLPNLKYAKPKYKNIESMLKYVERDADKGGVKLVIMNFND